MFSFRALHTIWLTANSKQQTANYKLRLVTAIKWDGANPALCWHFYTFWHLFTRYKGHQHTACVSPLRRRLFSRLLIPIIEACLARNVLIKLWILWVPTGLLTNIYRWLPFTLLLAKRWKVFIGNSSDNSICGELSYN